MKILVTGSSGQVGRELMARLEASEHEAVPIDREHGDLADRDWTVQRITAERPAIIIHAAAFTAVDRCEVEVETATLGNVDASRHVAEGARSVGAHVVYLSTDYVFDGTKPSPYVESDVPNPQSGYGRTKRAGERAIDPEWTIVRTSWVSGFHGHNMVKTVLALATGDGELSFVDDQIGHPTFAGDLADTLIELVEDPVHGILHATNQGVVSWYGFVRAILDAGGHDPDRVRPITTSEFIASRPADAPPLAPRPANSVLDSDSGRPLLRDFHAPLAELVGRLQRS